MPEPIELIKLIGVHGAVTVLAALATCWGWWERRQNAKWQTRSQKMQERVLSMATAQTSANVRAVEAIRALETAITIMRETLRK